MVTVGVSKLCLLSVGDLSLVLRSNENTGHVETGHNCESFVDTVVVVAGGEQDFGMKRIDWQFAHRPANLCQLTFIIKCTQIV